MGSHAARQPVALTGDDDPRGIVESRPRPASCPLGRCGVGAGCTVEHDDQFCAHGFTPRGNHDPLQRFLDRAHGSFQNDGIVKAEFDMLAPGMTEASITDALDVG